MDTTEKISSILINIIPTLNSLFTAQVCNDLFGEDGPYIHKYYWTIVSGSSMSCFDVNFGEFDCYRYKHLVPVFNRWKNEQIETLLGENKLRIISTEVLVEATSKVATVPPPPPTRT